MALGPYPLRVKFKPDSAIKALTWFCDSEAARDERERLLLAEGHSFVNAFGERLSVTPAEIELIERH